MEKPVFPTAHAQLTELPDLGWQLTLTTHLTDEMVEHVDQTQFVCGEMITKLRDIADGPVTSKEGYL